MEQQRRALLGATNGYTALSTPDVDPYFSNVSLLMHMDGANNSTTFVDNSLNGWTVTPYGDSKISTTDPKFGSGCLTLDGSGDYLTLPANSAFQFGTGDFTVEYWFYTNSGNTNKGLFTFGGSSSGLNSSILGGNWRVSLSGSDGTVFDTVTLNTWQHFAITRSSGSLRVFVNGIQKLQANSPTNLTDNQLKIGYYYSSIYSINGRLDEFRVTKGVARYITNFTPLTSSFPNQ